jgi:hypothetical protein
VQMKNLIFISGDDEGETPATASHITVRSIH